MAHVISTVTIDGTPKCANEGLTTHTVGRVWRTEVSYVGDAASEEGSPSNPTPTPPEKNTDDPNDLWLLARNYNTDPAGTVTGSIKFGVICVQTIEVRFTTDIDVSTDSIDLIARLNGTEIFNQAAPSATGAGQTTDYTIDLTAADNHERPCGNVIELEAVVTKTNAGDNIWAYVEITDVT
jgi:hypothetical protein